MEGMEHVLLENPTNIEVMAEKMRLLLTDDAERANISAAVREIAERYTISNNAQRFVNLYQPILESLA